MADGDTMPVPTQCKITGSVPLNSVHNCMNCIELTIQLKETEEELKSARLIIELLQRESVPRITSNQVDSRGSRASLATTNQDLNTEWREVSLRCKGSNNKDKCNCKKDISSNANMHLSVANRFSILEEVGTEEGDHGVLQESKCDQVQSSFEPHRAQDSEGKLFCKIPTIINGIVTMAIKNNTPPRTLKKFSNIKKSASTRIINPNSRIQHKVFILGDSHFRGGIGKLRSVLSSKFEVSGVIRPGASSDKIVSSSSDELRSLHLQDVLILNAGANDVYKNSKELALTKITKFVQKNYGTNIIILDIPHRHDLSPSSCLNLEIEEFNRKLKKIATPYNHVSVCETNLKRECFTRHGLHWNSLGKDLVVKLLKHQINKVIGKSVQAPISLAWKDSTLVVNESGCNEGVLSLSDVVEVDVNVDSDDGVYSVHTEQLDQVNRSDEINHCRTSKRQRKAPVTRKDDFLWQTSHRK